ncbi:nucleoside transporter protein [Toxoplasma gondii GAB2-2007-GAL-DOM2]|uniref:Nucleoside transporter protein n=12 Tax=Toxoplasma gondii TaxID=5811 RepID=B9PTZ0_TOXGV|nr:nucleoside transporter protein [Toxoplasma gondii GT1]ESS33802.1 nucleoside transporter protein [Toxoplasma gondii VEG]KAF4644345.1 nucleoside transporter protein [Toxoplasma gondii]KFG28898.1 nucleoside transporter protein [Toxoplasma gondii p89]KFG42816.1 nucleoside transporter protein [Toxoplasma gondii GAB2-2007-GAL-DOM2]KFG53213.1 nucleoside transporter protein [Toxoplasma gondii FOU]KFH08816.1 nucleoside transporter protein [Toxoplasma gondii VAND]KYF45251.1 nucleoside transporter p
MAGLDTLALEDVDLDGPLSSSIGESCSPRSRGDSILASQQDAHPPVAYKAAFLHCLTPPSMRSNSWTECLEGQDDTSLCSNVLRKTSSNVSVCRNSNGKENAPGSNPCPIPRASVASDRETPCHSEQKSCPFTERDRVAGFLTFLVCGVASLSCWQFLLSMTPYIEMTFFQSTPIGNSLLGVYQVGCICVQLVLMFLVDSMQPWIVILATLVDAGLAVTFPLVVTLVPDVAKAALMHIVSLLFGVSAGVICGGSIPVASAMPYNFIGSFSMGQGVAGILSFSVNLVFSFLFDLGSEEGVSSMLWLVFGISSVVSIVSAGLLFFAVRQPWAARQLTRYWEAKRSRRQGSRWAEIKRRWRCDAAGRELPVIQNEVFVDESANRTAHAIELKKQNLQSSEKKSAVHYDVDAADQTARSRGNSSVAVSLPVSKVEFAASEEQKQQSSEVAEEKSHGISVFGKRKQGDAVGLRLSGKVQAEQSGRGAAAGQTFSSRPAGSELCVGSREGTECELNLDMVNDECHWPSRGWRYFLRDSGIFLFCVFFNFFVTLNLFPRVGPIMWHYPGFAKNGPQYIILFGLFSIGDLCGKSLPDLATLSPRVGRWLTIPEKLLLPIVLSRVVLAVFFLLGAYLVNAFFNSFALYVILILLLSVTSGWCATASMVYACSSVKRFEEKEIVGPMSVLMLLVGIMAGVYSALAY